MNNPKMGFQPVISVFLSIFLSLSFFVSTLIFTLFLNPSESLGKGPPPLPPLLPYGDWEENLPFILLLQGPVHPRTAEIQQAQLNPSSTVDMIAIAPFVILVRYLNSQGLTTFLRLHLNYGTLFRNQAAISNLLVQKDRGTKANANLDPEAIQDYNSIKLVLDILSKGAAALAISAISQVSKSLLPEQTAYLTLIPKNRFGFVPPSDFDGSEVYLSPDQTLSDFTFNLAQKSIFLQNQSQGNCSAAIAPPQEPSAESPTGDLDK